ncbi:MAG: DUF1801 domain-containing protein [Rhodobacteraceae bacterium]|jgi:Domain of unknown function (DU1801)|nr:DUF1801 domain-containing protein [Paracoccaceae bacterium]
MAVTALDVGRWLATVVPERQAEAARLLQIFADETGFAPQLWPGGIVGFGRYAYRYDSGHGGISLATGFAPRKADLSIYIMPGDADHTAILVRLGKHRMGKACLYLRRLSDADEGVLRALIRAGLADLSGKWPVTPA